MPVVTSLAAALALETLGLSGLYARYSLKLTAAQPSDLERRHGADCEMSRSVAISHIPSRRISSAAAASDCSGRGLRTLMPAGWVPESSPAPDDRSSLRLRNCTMASGEPRCRQLGHRSSASYRLALAWPSSIW